MSLKSVLLVAPIILVNFASANPLSCRLNYVNPDIANTKAAEVTYQGIINYHINKNAGSSDYDLFAPHWDILKTANPIQYDFLKQLDSDVNERLRRSLEGKKEDKKHLYAWDDNISGIKGSYTQDIIRLLSGKFGQRAIYQINNRYQVEAMKLLTAHLSKIKSFSGEGVDVATFITPYELILKINNKEQIERLEKALKEGLFDREFKGFTGMFVSDHFSFEPILDGKPSISFNRRSSSIADKQRFIYNQQPPHKLNFSQFRLAILESLDKIRTLEKKLSSDMFLDFMSPERKSEIDNNLWAEYKFLASLLTSLNENKKFNKHDVTDFIEELNKKFYGFWAKDKSYLSLNEEPILTALKDALK